MNADVLGRLGLVGDLQEFPGGFSGSTQGGQRRISSGRHLGRKFLAAFPHGVFACRPVALIAPYLGSRPASASLKTPAKLSRSQRALVEARRGTVEIFARTRPGIKATLPAPLVDVDWATGTARDRADTHIAEIDVPTVLKFGIQAAGKFEHGLLKRSQDASGKLLGICAPSTGATQFISPSPIEFPRLKLAIELNEDCDLACPQFQMR
jgi:hypothetical protein